MKLKFVLTIEKDCRLCEHMKTYKEIAALQGTIKLNRVCMVKEDILSEKCPQYSIHKQAKRI